MSSFSTSLLGLTFKPLDQTFFGLDPYQETFSNNWVCQRGKTIGEYQLRAAWVRVPSAIPLLFCIAIFRKMSIDCISQTLLRQYVMRIATCNTSLPGKS